MNISDLEPLIALDAKDVPYPLLSSALMRSLREFFRETYLWHHTETITPLSGNTTVTLTSLPVNTELCGIAECDFTVYNTKEIQRLDPDWRTYTDSTIDALVYDDTLDAQTIYLYPALNADALPFSITVAVKPILTATTIPDRTVEWDTVIASGALAWLKAMEGRPWTDRDAVTLHAEKFRTGCDRARIARSTATGRPKPLRTTTYGF